MDSTFHRPFALALALSCLAASPAHAQLSAGDACPEPTPGRVFTQEGAAGPALVCNGTTLEVYESVLTGPLRKGIGTASPAAKLDVVGEVKVGNTSLACSGTTEGAQRYNSTSHVMEYCNGTSWVGFGSGVTSNCPTSDVTSGLVARWKFDESSGTTAADSSGNSLTGTLTNGPVWNPNNGYLNGALTFDGSNDYVTVADPGTGSVLDFAGGSSMTITAWVMVGLDANT